jgi:hypothetical protein
MVADDEQSACPEPPSLAELQAGFPDWNMDRGLSGRYYAWRPEDSPVVSGEDLLDLRDQVLGWILRRARDELSTAGRVRSLACSWCQAPTGVACDQLGGADHLLRYARARHAGLITLGEHAAARPDLSLEGGAPMVTAVSADG